MTDPLWGTAARSNNKEHHALNAILSEVFR